MSSRMSVFLVCVLLTGSAVQAGELSADERKLQTEFKAAYNNPDATARAKALEMLAPASHQTTREMLVAVYNFEREPLLRKAAFETLAKLPVHDPGASTMLVNLFLTIKQSDMALKMEYAELMKHSEFKYAIYEALVDLGSKQRYPDLITWDRGNSGNPGGSNGMIGGDPNVGIKKSRAEFEKYMSTFNKVTGAKLSAEDKNAPAEFKKWWNENKEKVIAADKALFQKYFAEDSAKLNTALVPAGAVKKDAAAVKEKMNNE